MKFLVPLFSLALLISCGEQPEKAPLAEHLENTPAPESRQLSEAFKAYWYAGEAEISSYRLKQARYGEMRDGHAVLVFVTEPFVRDKQVKADRSNPGNVSVLKLNSSRKFLTGVYPYSIMSSTFSPVKEAGHALKVTNSVQEWCGQVFAQLNNRDQFQLQSFSYFESEGDEAINLPKNWLENELWNLVRINPEELPLGDIKVIPAFEYLRLAHRNFKAYEAKASKASGDGMTTYTLEYPELQRELRIRFQSDFPHRIEGWEESYQSGFGSQAKALSSSAERITTLKSPYWRKNSNKDEYLRDSLGLR